MKATTKFFYDFEATGLERDCNPISLGIMGTYVNHDTGVFKKGTFYAEFTDYSIEKCNDWVKENVISKISYPDEKMNSVEHYHAKGDYNYIKKELHQWLEHFGYGEKYFWADCDLIDKPLLTELLSGSLNLPFGIKYYNFFDFNTLLKSKEQNLENSRYSSNHNALEDAIQLCNLYYKLENEGKI